MSAPAEFDDLRRHAIGRAQKASGNIWTDYNVHDPGVALIELFCFALTELDYRADFPVADLLANPEGRLQLKEQDLFRPAEALPTSPVTLGDWETAISHRAPSVARVFVHRHEATGGAAHPGLYDIYVVPADAPDMSREEAEARALQDVRTWFDARRNLCEDIAVLEAAKPIDVRLHAEVRVRGHDAPHRVAAEIYDLCDQLLQGHADFSPERPATRRDVAEAPELYYGPSRDLRREQVSLVRLFDAIARIEQVAGVISLTLTPSLETPLAKGAYHRIQAPRPGEEPGLRLTVADREAPFDIHEMRVERARLRTQRRLSHELTLDRDDWSAEPHGRRRDFSHTPLGAGLPRIFLADGEALSIAARPEDRASAAQIRGYLAHFDAVLASVTEDVAHFYELYSSRFYDPCPSRAAKAETYFPGTFDLAAVRRAIRHSPEPEAIELADVIARQDPRHDRKGRTLDYLLALYAERFSQNSLRRHDLYRSAAGRRDAVLDNRARLLREVAHLSRSRFFGGPASGLARKLEILLDFPERGDDKASHAFEAVRLTEDPTPDGDGGPTRRRLPSRHRRAAPRIPSNRLRAAADVLTMLAPRVKTAPASPLDLTRQTAFLHCMPPSDDVIRAGALQDSWLLTPADRNRWRLFFLPQRGGDAYLAATCATRKAAIERANQLRAMFAEANRKAEAVYVIEDILLRSGHDDPEVRPMFLWVVISGWTVRTRDPDFRELAEETVVGLCPAHLSHRVVWLDRWEMKEFESILAKGRTAASANQRLRTFLSARPDAA